MPKVASLHVHPVKSLRGISVREARLERRGLRHDRRWMIVDAGGRYVTQREHPRLALVDVAIEAETRRLVVRAPGESALIVPFDAGGARREVEIWKDRVAAVSVSEEASAYFTRDLGAPMDLVLMPDDVERAVSSRHGRAGDVVGFADAFPLLLVSTSSLDDLCARMGARMAVERFRANIVVEGAPAFAEDGWKTVRIGGVGFRVAKPCERCAIPTVDIETGAAGKEPLATLATFRRSGAKVTFGQNLAHDGVGVLRVGDEVEVVG